MQALTLVAHRGHVARYPENTLPALEDALRLGAPWIEFDVQLSRDAVPYLFHDRQLTRLCALNAAVHELDSAQLSSLRTAEIPLARLDQVPPLLARYPHAQAFVEIKRVALEQHGAARVLERVRSSLASIAARCVWISFDFDFLWLARQQGIARLGAVIDRWEERLDPRLERLQPEFLFADLEGLPAQGELRFGNAQLVIYEVGDASTARALHSRGVGSVETFRWQELEESLRA